MAPKWLELLPALALFLALFLLALVLVLALLNGIGPFLLLSMGIGRLGLQLSINLLKARLSLLDIPRTSRLDLVVNCLWPILKVRLCLARLAIPGLTRPCRVCRVPSLLLRSEVVVRSLLCPVVMLRSARLITVVIVCVLLVMFRRRVVRLCS